MKRAAWPVVWGPVIAYAGLVVFMSSLSASDLGPSVIWRFDKLIHTAEYAVLGALSCRALLLGPGLSARWAVPLAIVAAFLFGLSDEWHQSFVPGRDSSGWDALADLTGAILGSTAYLLASRRLAPARTDS